MAAYIGKHGHSSVVIDGFAMGVEQRTEMFFGALKMYLYGLTGEQIAEKILSDTDVIGISCPFNQQAPIIPAIAKAIKVRYPQKLIVLGGPYAIAFPQKALTDNLDIDVVVRGEGELPMLHILEGKPLTEITGVLFRKDDGTIVDSGATAPVVKNMDELPFPARHLLPMERYFRRSARGGDMKHAKPISFTTSRGCPCACKFCSLHNEENDYGYAFRWRSADNVMAEIAHLKKMYGPDVIIQFEDDNILIRKDRAKEIFRKLAFQNVKWAIHSGVMIKLLDEELIMLMKQSGCEQLNLALESGNATVLKAMDKRLDLNHAANVVRWCKKHGVNMLAFLIVGYPGETDQTWAETLATLKKFKKLGLRKVAPFTVCAHPSTPLYEEAFKNGWLRNTDATVYNAELIQIETEDFNEAKVREWTASIEAIMHPYRLFMKRILKFLLPQSGYRELLGLIRVLKRARMPAA